MGNQNPRNPNQTKTKQAEHWMKSHKMCVGLATLAATGIYITLTIIIPEEAVKIAIGYVVCLVTLGVAIDLTEHDDSI